MSLKNITLYCILLCLIFNRTELLLGIKIIEFLISIFLFSLLYLTINYTDMRLK